MITSGTKEHLDFLSHLNDNEAVGTGEELSFEKIHETVYEQFTQIKVNLMGVCNYKKSTSIKVIAERESSCLHETSANITQMDNR